MSKTRIIELEVPLELTDDQIRSRAARLWWPEDDLRIERGQRRALESRLLARTAETVRELATRQETAEETSLNSVTRKELAAHAAELAAEDAKLRAFVGVLELEGDEYRTRLDALEALCKSLVS